MKVAVLTLPLHINYGGNLQCFALCKVLKNMGLEVEAINMNVVIPWHRLLLYNIKRFIYMIFNRNALPLFYEQKKDKELQKYIPLTNRHYGSIQALMKLGKKNKFDAFIVGSDQVWRKAYAKPTLETYFLDFLISKKIKKVAYAASFGMDIPELSNEEIARCGALLSLFDGVSVRENSSLKLIKEDYKWDIPVKCLLDPTMLLSLDDYKELIQNIKSHTENRSVCYILDMTKDKQDIIDSITAYKNIPAFILPSLKQFSKDYSFVDWLAAIYNSEFVITDSFHGCVFSIIFNKPFIAYGNYKRGISRFTSLLELFDLKYRLISSSEELSLDLINREIDWEHINYLKTTKKEESIRFLQESLLI